MQFRNLKPTGNFETINGGAHRIWVGRDDAGAEVAVCISIVKVAIADCARYDKELYPVPISVKDGGLIHKYFL